MSILFGLKVPTSLNGHSIAVTSGVVKLFIGTSCVYTSPQALVINSDSFCELPSLRSQSLGVDATDEQVAAMLASVTRYTVTFDTGTECDLGIAYLGTFDTDLNGGTWTGVKNFAAKPYIAAEPTPVLPSVFPTPEEDKARLKTVTALIKSGTKLTDDDAIFYAVGASGELSIKAMYALDTGGGYDALRTVGLTDTQALKALAIYNITPSPSKYESEKAFETIASSPANLQSFIDYCITNAVPLPNLTSELKTTPAVYAAARAWAAVQ